MDMGDTERARDAYRRQKTLIDSTSDREMLGDYYNGLGLLQNKAGEKEEAVASFRECARLAYESGDLGAYQAAIGNEGHTYIDLGRMDDALRSLKRQEEICRRINHREGLVGALDNRGLALAELKRHGEALELHIEAERIAREIGFHYGLTQAMSHAANVLLFLGRDEEGLERLGQLVDLWRNGNIDRLNNALHAIASVRYLRGEGLAKNAQLVDAADEFRRSVGAALKSGQMELADAGQQYLLWTLRQHVEGLFESGEDVEAMSLLREMERVLMDRPQDSEEMSNVRDSMFCALKRIAGEQEKNRHVESAFATVELMAEIADKLDDDERRREALRCKLSVLQTTGDLAVDSHDWEKALESYGSAEEIATLLGDNDATAICRSNQMAALRQRTFERYEDGDFSEALQSSERVMELIGKIDVDPRIEEHARQSHLTFLGAAAEMALKRNEHEVALRLYSRGESLASELGLEDTVRERRATRRPFSVEFGTSGAVTKPTPPYSRSLKSRCASTRSLTTPSG